MQCSELQQHIDDRLDDQLDAEMRAAMDAHLVDCASCRSSVREAQALREMLSDMPVPVPSAGFAARALRQAAVAHSVVSTRHHKRVFASGFAAAMMVGVVLWFVTGIYGPQGEPGLAPQEQLAEVTIRLQETRRVRLAFNAPTDMERVRVSLELPEHVELEGYPGRKQIAWYTRLHKGDNVLSLPLSGLKASKGKFIARIGTGAASREIHINLNVAQPGVSTLSGQLSA